MNKDIDLDVHKYIDSTFKNGILKFVILNAISKKSAYPYQLYRNLCKVNFGVLTNIKKSEVYNTLNSLESKGFVKGESRLSGSKVQKEYKITAKGSKVAVKARKVMAKNVGNIKRLIEYEFK